MTATVPRTRAYVLDRWRTVYIVTPKAMCTSMLSTIAALHGETLDTAHSVQTAEVTRALAVHDSTLWQRTPLLHELSAAEIERIRTDDAWFRFALVRHPVERLWSAWQSKLLLREPAYVHRFGNEPWYPAHPHDIGTGPDRIASLAEQFERFVQALEHDQRLLIADQHWAPQHWLLCPDTFPYTVLGRVETITDTVNRLDTHLRGLGRREPVSVAEHNVGILPRRAVVRDVALLRRIENLYRDDMTRFGYASAPLGRSVAPSVVAATLPALGEIVARNERIGDLHQMVMSNRPATTTVTPRRRRVSLVALATSMATRLPPVPPGVEAVAVAAGAEPVTTGIDGWRVLRPPRQTGAAARFAAGVAATSGDIVVLMRNVTALTPDWVDLVHNALTDRDTGLVSAVIEPHRSHGMALAGLEISDEMLNCRWCPLPAEPPSTIEVAAVSSTFLAVRRATLDYLGGLDTGLVSEAWHDVELSVRAWRCRFRSVVLHDVVAQWRPPPPPSSQSFLHDLVRVAASHLEPPAFAAALTALHDSSDLTAVLGTLLGSDVGTRRARLAPLMQRSTAEFLSAVGVSSGGEQLAGRQAS